MTEQKAVHNALQDFISDPRSKPAEVYFPRFRNHYKCGINLRKINGIFNDTKYENEREIRIS